VNAAPPPSGDNPNPTAATAPAPAAPAAPRKVRTAPVVADKVADKAVVQKREVRINSVPWSLVSVDGEGERHETIYPTELTVGRHQVDFYGEAGELRKTIVIIVKATGANEFVEYLH
jgi:hypothetical protein